MGRARSRSHARRASAANSKRFRGLLRAGAARSFCRMRGRVVAQRGRAERACVCAPGGRRVAFEDLVPRQRGTSCRARRDPSPDRRETPAFRSARRDPADGPRARVRRPRARARRRAASRGGIRGATRGPGRGRTREARVVDAQIEPMMFDGEIAVDHPRMGMSERRELRSTIAQTTLHGRCIVCIHSCTLRPGRTSMTKNGLPSASCRSRARGRWPDGSRSAARASC